jgi:hypothetical protein
MTPSIDQDSKLVEAVRQVIAENHLLVSDGHYGALARAIIPIVLLEAAGVAGSFATKARGREPENVYDSALYIAGHTIADAIRSLASDVKDQ